MLGSNSPQRVDVFVNLYSGNRNFTRASMAYGINRLGSKPLSPVIISLERVTCILVLYCFLKLLKVVWWREERERKPVVDPPALLFVGNE